MAVVVLVAAARPAMAQGGPWTATLIVQPFPSAFVADWQRNPQTAILTLLYTGTAAADFRVEGFVRSPDRGELARVVSPPLGFGFGPVTQLFTSADILEWATVFKNQQYVDLVLRTGVMPEGPLQMCARVIDLQNAELLAPVCADFTITLPDPPQLIFPTNGGSVAGLQPVFQWTPVLVPPELGVSYRVRIVERYQDQAPATAMQANPVWFEEDVTGAPVLVYPLNALPLDAAKEYVWRVEALDADGNRLTRGGRSSELWTFRLGGPARGGSLASLPDTLDLIPGVVRLTGLRGLDVSETDFAYTLDGAAQLDVLAPFAASVRVQVAGFELDKNSIQLGAMPVVRAGSVSGSVPSGLIPPAIGGTAVQFTSIAFDVDGLTLGGTLVLPGATGVELAGRARITGAGVYGTLEATGTGGQPLLAVGEDPARLRVRRARVTLPGGAVALDGELEVFAKDIGCSGVSATIRGDGTLEANVACNPTQPLALAGSAVRAQIALRSLTGSFAMALGTAATPQFTLTASGEFRLDAGSNGRPGANCGASMGLRLANDGVTVPQFTPRCDAGEGESELGWLRTRLSSLSLRRFAYTKGQGFDFELSVDLAPWLPAIPGFQLPPLLAVTLTPQGLAIPAIDVGVTQPPFEVAGFALAVKRVRLPAFTLSWADWQARSADDFRFSFDADLTLPHLPGASCLTAQPISITGAELGGGKLKATLAERRFTPACALTLGAGESEPAQGGTATAAGGGDGGGGGGGGGECRGYGPTLARCLALQTALGSTGGVIHHPCSFEEEIKTMQYADGQNWRSECPPTEVDVLSRPPGAEPLPPWPNDAARQADIDAAVADDERLAVLRNRKPCDAACEQEIAEIEARARKRYEAWRLRDLPWLAKPSDLVKHAVECIDAERQKVKDGTSTKSSKEIEAACGLPELAAQVSQGLDLEACLAIERQRQILGVTEEGEEGSMERCRGVEALARVDAVARSVLTLPPADAPLAQQRGFCTAVAPYGLGLLLGAERQRQLLGLGDSENNVTSGPTADVLGYCENVQRVQMNELCSATPPDTARINAVKTKLLGTERTRQMLGLSSDEGASEILTEVMECLPPNSLPGSSAGGEDDDGGSSGGDVAAAARRGAAPWTVGGSFPDPFADWIAPDPGLGAARVVAQDTPGAFRLELERYGGQLVLGLYPFPQIERVPEIEGAIVLPALFQCDDETRRQPLVTKLRLGSRGEVEGQVIGLVPSCPIDLAAVQLRVTQSTLTFSTAAGAQAVVLRASAEARFTLSSSPVTGSGAISIDVLHGRLIDGSLAFQGPLKLDLPREQPVLSFTLQSASFDKDGIHADGRAELAVPGAPAPIGVTFDHVTINPQTVALTAGQVLFDAPFAFQVGVGNDGALAWGVIARSAPLTLQSGLRIDLPSQIALKPGGFTASGDGAARVVYGGRDIEGLVVKFSSNFALGFSPPGVAQGAVDFQRNGVSLAYIDAAGFHPNLAYFAAAILPAKLPLPSVDIAYLELRDAAGNLRVATENTGNGIRIYTAGGASVPLVIPSLQLGAPAAPQLDVSFDLTLDPLGEGVSLGSLSATVPTGSTAFDLSDRGLPLAFESIAYERAPGGAYRWTLTGALRLFGQRQGGGAGADRVQLSLDNAGRLTGNVNLTVNQSVQLVPASQQLTLRLDQIGGSFNADLPNRDFQFSLAAVGGVDVALSSGSTYTASARIAVSNTGVTVTDVAYVGTGGSDEPRYIDFGPVQLGLNHLRLPLLDYDRTNGFRFEVLFDATFKFPTLGDLRLPPISDIALRNSGFTIPAYDAPELNLTVPGLGGFVARVLAFRMDTVKFNWFTGQGPTSWGFGFDLELGFGQLIEGAPAALQNARARVLNAGFSNGRFTGSLERLSFPQPLELGIGQLFAISGTLPEGNAPFALTAELSIDLAATLGVCGNTKVTAPNTTLAIYGDGWVQGSINGIAPTCPGNLGAFKFQFGQTSLVFGYGTANGERTRSLEIAAAATVQFPGLQEGDTVSASGSVRFDALQGRWISGRIDVLQPFRYTSPDNNPYLAFEVSRASLDQTGLTFSGQGRLRGKDGAQITAQLNDLTISLPDFKVSAGNVTFINQFALGVGIGTQGLEWGVLGLNAPRPSGASFRAVIPDTIRIDAQGLYLGGSGSAELAYGDSVFLGIQVRFIDGFRIGFNPLVVTAGRANFLRGPDEIAHIDAGGFWPGNLFAVLPLPARLGLPNDSVAYLELRNAQNVLVVDMQTGPNGLQVRTKPNVAVKLVVPALKDQAGVAPEVNVAFDVVVNPSSFQIISGFVRAESPAGSPALFSLDRIGVPLAIRKIAYEPVSGSVYGLRLGARFKLPESLNGLDVDIPDLTISTQGLTGEVRLGSYIQPAPATPPVLVSQSFMGDTLKISVTGAMVKFGASPEFGITGVISTLLFKRENEPPALIYWSGNVTGQDFTFQLDDTKNATKLPLYIAEFEPKAVGTEPALRVTASAQEFKVRLSGVLTVPDLSPTFAATIAGFQVGTGGVVFPTISISGVDQQQELELFGAKFRLKDSTANGQMVYPALKVEPSNGAVAVTLSGQITFLENTSSFYGLRVSTRGEVSLAAAKLLSNPIEVVQNYFWVDSLNIANNALRADLSVMLPEPLNTGGKQRGYFTVNTRGEVSGGVNLALINQQPSVTGEPPTHLDMGGFANIHLRYLGLKLDFAHLRDNSAVEIVTDIYVQGKAENRIKWGDVVGGTVQPGLRIGFNGSVTLGTISMGNAFQFDLEAVKLKITEVAFPPQTQGFAVSISGELSLNVSAVSGFLTFEGFTITSQGDVVFSPDGIKGGGLKIADILSLEVFGFGFSATPTQIKVQGGGMPSGNTGPSSAEQTIDVNSYVTFGGRISILDVFSGGVDQFLLYRDTQNYTHLLIRNANLKIMDFVTFSADFKYDESAAGWEMLLGGKGKIMGSYEITVVGALAQDTKTRFGMFLAVTGLTIQIGPYVQISGLGGGFFLNPKTEWIDYVRLKAGVAQTQGVNIETPPDASFAIMLFGEAGIVTSALIKGRILLTITDVFFRLDGFVQILSQGDRFQGDIHLQIAFKSASVQGNIGFQINYGAVVDGKGFLDFYVFSEQAWGIHGEAHMKIIAMLQADAELMIGPPGFYLHASITAGFNIWVIQIDQVMEATLWYQDASKQWGAYVKIGLKVSVLGGVLSAEGMLHGALILTQGDPLIFAAASLKASVVGTSWEGWVWVKFQSNQVTGGFGQDPSMMEAIAKAQSVGDEMKNAKDETQAAVDQAKQLGPPAVSLTTADLAAAYRNLQKWNSTGYGMAMGLIEWQEDYGGADNSTIQAYRTWYIGVLKQHGAPGDTNVIRQYATDVANGFAAVSSDRPQVEARIAALTMQIQQLNPLAANATAIGTNPVRSESFTPPKTHKETKRDGLTYDVVDGGGLTFDVDANAANAQQTALDQVRQQAAANDQLVREQIAALEGGLARLRAATTAGDAGALPTLVGRYADIATKAEQQFAAQADYLLQREDWFNARLAELRTKRSTATGWIFPKTAAYRTANRYEDLKSLARARLNYLQSFRGVTNLVSDFDNQLAALTSNATRWDFVMKQADSSGIQLWYDLADVGMADALTQSPGTFATLKTQADQRLGTIRNAHESLSNALAGLYQVQAEATGALYDLYDRYLFWRTGETSTAPAGSTSETTSVGLVTGIIGTIGGFSPAPAGPPAPPQASDLLNVDLLRNRRSALAQDLTVPRINSVQVTSTSTSRYTAQLQFTWSAWHPSGAAYDFQFRDEAGANTGLGGAMFSNGGRGTLTSYRFTPDRSVATTLSRTFQVGARAGAGFNGQGRANYTLSFVQGPNIVAGASSTGLTTDNTPPSTPVVSFRGLREAINAQGVLQMWTSDPDRVTATWSADDPESGIGEYEYALWSTASGQQIRPFVSAGGRLEVTVDRLGLTVTTPVYVAVRAKNGQGVLGPTGVSAALRYDPTPPVPAVGASVAPWSFTVFVMPSPAAATYTPCPINQPLLPGTPLGVPLFPVGAIGWSGGGEAPTGAAPTRLFRAPAFEDQESGVATYLYKVTQQPETTYTEGAWTQFVPSNGYFTVQGAPLDYTGTFYVSVVARNAAGLMSRPVVSPAFTVPDPSAPSMPEYCAGANSGPSAASFYASITNASADEETQVAGYQYRVRDQYGTVVRDWPATGTDWSSGSGARNTALLNLVNGMRYYLDVRALNGQSMTSPWVTSGLVAFDNTAPPTPSGAFTWYFGSMPTLTVTIPVDPETGITSLQWAVGTSETTADVSAWQAVSVSGGVVTFNVTVPATLVGPTLWARFRSVNGAGVPSAIFTTSVAPPQPPTLRGIR
jgi:hypothetical protein